jgi:iron complex outermembrane receptor protein
MKKMFQQSVCVVALLAGAAPAWAQSDVQADKAAPEEQDDRLDEIVVTATKTGETQLQRTPVAVSVVSGDRLSASGIVNVKDLVQVAPSVNVAQFTASPVIYIRGIGSNNVLNGSDPDVTVQIDGVYLSRPYAAFTDFVDVERIEVLRGPQGTLYGRNAVGGTLNVISRKPSNEFTAKAQLTVGNFKLFQAQAYVSGPLIADKLQVSVTGNYYRHSAYVDNIVPGQKDIGNANRGGGRVQLRFTPSDGVEFITRADYSESSENFDSYSHLLAPVAYAPLASSTVGDYTKVALDDPDPIRTKFWGISQEVNIDLATGLTFKSLTAYRYSSHSLDNDTDATEVYVNHAFQSDVDRQFSQEFNLTANLAKFDGVAGLYYFTDRDETNVTGRTPPSPAIPAANAARNEVLPIAHTRSLAAFAQGTYHFTDQFSAVVGARYTTDRKEVDQVFNRTRLDPANLGAFFPGFPFIANSKRDYHAFTPKFGLNYQATPDVLIYASATRGYKSGGTNFAAASVAALTFKPETIWAYEAGLKSELFDRRLRVNVSAFKYDYKDLQVQALTGIGLVTIANAATARVKGLEIETTAKPFAGLQLAANYAYLDAKYQSFPNAALGATLIPYLTGDPLFTPATRTYNASGKRLNAAPEHSFSASAQYDIPVGAGSVFLRGEYYWQSRTHYDASNVRIMSEPSYNLVNGSIGYNDPDSKFRVQLLAKNLTQTRYLIVRFANGVVPSGLAAAPRTVMLQVSKGF